MGGKENAAHATSFRLERLSSISSIMVNWLAGFSALPVGRLARCRNFCEFGERLVGRVGLAAGILRWRTALYVRLPGYYAGVCSTLRRPPSTARAYSINSSPKKTYTPDRLYRFSLSYLLTSATLFRQISLRRLALAFQAQEHAANPTATILVWARIGLAIDYAQATAT